MRLNSRKTFVELLSGDEIIVAPGAYDAFSARIIEETGFKALFVPGSALAICMGYPDNGLVTMSEVLARVKQITDAVRIPVIADCDTGYGSAINLMRTVREFEQLGVAGMVFEDQMPDLKRCGHEKPCVVSQEEMLNKIDAALEARDDKDFVIIARTDARGRYGIEEALKRGKAYAKAGADVIFPLSLNSVEELKMAARSIDVPVMTSQVAGSETPFIPAHELQEMGIKMVIFAAGTLRVAGKAIRDLMQEIKRTGTDKGFHDRYLSIQERNDLVGKPAIESLRRKFVKFPGGDD